MSDTVGEDFNDTHQRLGLFRSATSLREALFPTRIQKDYSHV